MHTNLAVPDSLLYNPSKPTLAQLVGQRVAKWFGGTHALDDDETARGVLGRPHAAVVGNPPYITVKDAVLRDVYRENYPQSAAGKYSLAAPFTECFFQLARDRGKVGMITANSFMKREFGKRLIEDYLRTMSLDLVVNISGAFIPATAPPRCSSSAATKSRRAANSTWCWGVVGSRSRLKILRRGWQAEKRGISRRSRSGCVSLRCLRTKSGQHPDERCCLGNGC